MTRDYRIPSLAGLLRDGGWWDPSRKGLHALLTRFHKDMSCIAVVASSGNVLYRSRGHEIDTCGIQHSTALTPGSTKDDQQ